MSKNLKLPNWRPISKDGRKNTKKSFLKMQKITTASTFKN